LFVQGWFGDDLKGLLVLLLVRATFPLPGANYLAAKLLDELFVKLLKLLKVHPRSSLIDVGMNCGDGDECGEDTCLGERVARGVQDLVKSVVPTRDLKDPLHS
jgi:hypothetical protein